MNSLVVDSSVVAKWVLPEPDSETALSLLAHADHKGTRLVVQDLDFPEVANAIWQQQRQRLITREKAEESIDTLLGCDVHIESAIGLI